jgi:hypothetical protein
VPFPSSIGLYQPGQGYPKFDQKKADEYYRKVNEKVFVAHPRHDRQVGRGRPLIHASACSAARTPARIPRTSKRRARWDSCSRAKGSRCHGGGSVGLMGELA